MTRVLLTGAGGFIGHHILQHLLENTTWDIVATDSFRHYGKTDRIGEVLSINPDWQQRVTIVTHDLTAPFSDQMAYRIARDGLDYLIAVAGHTHVPRSIDDPVPFIRNNFDVMLNTLELARVIKPRVVIDVSTDEVYGPIKQGQTPYPEWSTPYPSSPYSGSKAAQEAIAIAYWRTYQVPLIITNLMNAYGERQDKEKFVPLLIDRISRDQVVYIHGRPGDIGSRHYLHARDAAAAWLFLLEKTTPAMSPDTTRPDRYNIANRDPISNLELASTVASIIGKPLRYELVSHHRPGHDFHYGLDTSKLSGLGWEAALDFRESLEQTVRWTLAHPEWLL